MVGSEIGFLLLELIMKSFYIGFLGCFDKLFSIISVKPSASTIAASLPDGSIKPYSKSIMVNL